MQFDALIIGSCVEEDMVGATEVGDTQRNPEDIEKDEFQVYIESANKSFMNEEFWTFLLIFLFGILVSFGILSLCCPKPTSDRQPEYEECYSVEGIIPLFFLMALMILLINTMMFTMLVACIIKVIMK